MENNFVPEVFLSEKFGELRIAEIDDKPYFCGIDVAKALGYSNPRDAIGRHCKQNGVVKHDTISTHTKEVMVSHNRRFLYPTSQKATFIGSLLVPS